MTSAQRIHLLFLLLVVVLAGAVCFHELDAKSFWLDEGFSVALASAGWPRMLDVIRTRDPNMGLYYVLLHFWLRVGSDEATIRAFSAATAVASVILLYLVGGRLLGSGTALLAALLFTLNGFVVRYAQEARSYALLVLLTLASSHLFIRAVRRPSASTWAAYIVVSTAAVYTHFFACWVLAAHFFSATLLRGRIWPRRDVLASYLLLVAAASPLILWTLTTDRRLFWIPPPTWSRLLDTLEDLAGDAGPVQLALYLGLSGWGLWFAWHARRTDAGEHAWTRGLLLAWFSVPIVASVTLSLLVTPMFWPRFLIVSVPPLILLAADGALAVRPRWIRGATVGLLIGLSARGVHAWYQSDAKEDWRGAAQYLSSTAEPGDGLILQPGNGRGVFEYYWRRISPDPQHLTPVFPPHPWGAYDPLDLVVYQPLKGWLAEHPLENRRIWIVEWQPDANSTEPGEPSGGRGLDLYRIEEGPSLNKMRVRMFRPVR